MTQFTLLKSDAAETIAQNVRESLPFSIPALFNGGVPGDYFVTDRQYLFQDRAGTVPVTAVGQPVRAIRGSIYGTLAAVQTDGAFWNYIEESGVGKILGLAASTRFVLPASLTAEQVLGWHGDDHGFVIAGFSENVALLRLAQLLADAEVYWYYLDQHVSELMPGENGLTDTYAGFATLAPTGSPNAYVYIFLQRIRPTSEGVTLIRRTVLGRTGNAYYAETNWADVLAPGYASAETTPTPLVLEADPPISPVDYMARGGNPGYGPVPLSFWGGILGTNTDVKHRSLLLLGRSVDLSLYSLIYDAL